MANKRVFVAFAIENETTKYLFTGQAKNKNVPFDFVDMSVKQPWDNNWKTNCRTKIKGCNGFIALISKDTNNATGQLWEINCAKDEGIPMIGIYIESASHKNKPDNMYGVPTLEWTWDNVKEFIESL